MQNTLLRLEDCVEQLDKINWDPPVDHMGVSYPITARWDRQFISDVAYHTRDNHRSLTSGQCKVIIGLINRYQIHLVLNGINFDDLTHLLVHQTTRLPVEPSSVVKREVRWVGDSKLAFRFKFDSGIRDAIKKLAVSDCFGTRKASFCHTNKLWYVPVSVGNYPSVMKIITDYGFSFDEDVVKFLAGISESRLKRPEATIENGEIVISVPDDAFMVFLASWIKNISDFHDV